MSGVSQRGILGPHVYDDVPFHTHEYSEISGELIISEAQITSLSASKITAGTIDAHTIIIAPGGVLKSADFVTGPGGAGWQLSAGLAEFNNITVRGQIFTSVGSEVASDHILSLDVGKLTAGTIGVEVIKLTDSSSSRIESEDGTSLIIQGDGAAVFTDITATGTINATTGTLTDLTVDGTLTMGSGGILRTASSGIRVELTNTDNEFISIYNASERVGTLGWSSVLSRFLMEAVNGNSIGLRGDALVFNADVTGTAWTNETGFKVDVGVGAADGDFIVEIDAAGSGDFHVSTGGAVRFAVENDGDVKVNGILQVGNGTAADPTMTFYNDPDLGVYRSTTNELGFAANGVVSLLIGTLGLRTINGVVTAPSYAFGNQTQTGVYLAATSPNGEVGLAGGGAEMFTGLNASPDEVRILPAYAHSIADTDDHVGVTSTGLLRRQTSSLRMKKFVSKIDPADLASIELAPVRYKRRGGATSEPGDADDAWHVGLIADWLIDQDERLGRRNDDGTPENFRDRAILAVLAAKDLVRVDELAELRAEVAELRESLEQLAVAA